MNKSKIILYALAAVALVSLALFGQSCYRARQSDKALEAYKQQRAETQKQNDALTKREVELRTKAEAAEKLAADKVQERDAAYTELAKFGAQGRAAEERLKKAGESFEVDKNRILNSADACRLCRDTCAERERLSSADIDVRCSEHLCDEFCVNQ
jgi:biopolymer transport protein ExbB/TolQ